MRPPRDALKMTLEPVINIPEHTVDVYLFNIARLNYDAAACFAVLEPQEQQQAEKFYRPALRQAYIHMHALMRQILAAYIPGESAADLRFTKGEYGKPYLEAAPALRFNLSHSGDWGLLAVGHDIEVGVDIETIKPRAGLAGLVAKCFSAAEQQYWQQLPPQQQVEVFFEIWTRKEALVKAVGRGIALGLEFCELQPPDLNQFSSLPAVCGPSAQWQILPLNVETCARAAIVVQANDYRIRMQSLSQVIASPQ